MMLLLRAWHRVRKLFLRSRQEREMMEEFASHIEMQTEDNLRLGRTNGYDCRRPSRIIHTAHAA
jgi:hypothetical protein